MEKIARIGTTDIEALKGDITEQDVDAVVNAANDRLWMGAGVAGAIKSAGGAEIEKEAVAKGPIDLGEAVATSGGRLRARYVIHAAVMGQDLRTGGAFISSATTSALQVADELALRSIAFPALGTGVGGFSMAQCARTMYGAVATHLAAGRTSLERIVFVLYGDEAYEVFVRELKQAAGG